MKLSRDARRQTKELFELAMVDGRLDAERLGRIATEITERKPRSYVQMLKFLTRLARLETARHHAVIESATPLAEAIRAEITASLIARFGQITAEFHHNPELIGGLRVRLGSDVWDGSVQSRLEALKQS
jgi:F-type H+-transporting ATPase subunit delta